MDIGFKEVRIVVYESIKTDLLLNWKEVQRFILLFLREDEDIEDIFCIVKDLYVVLFVFIFGRYMS